MPNIRARYDCVLAMSWRYHRKQLPIAIRNYVNADGITINVTDWNILKIGGYAFVWAQQRVVKRRDNTIYNTDRKTQCIVRVRYTRS